MDGVRRQSGARAAGGRAPAAAPAAPDCEYRAVSGPAGAAAVGGAPVPNDARPGGRGAAPFLSVSECVSEF